MNWCSFCQNEQEEVICIHSECVKKNINKMTCFKCFQKQHQDKKGHIPYKPWDIVQMAKENRKKLIDFLEGIIIKNENDFQETRMFLHNQKLTFIKWHDQQLKQAQEYFEFQNYSLYEQINKAQKLQMEEISNNLDTIIQYCLLNINQLQQQQFQDGEQFTNLRQLETNDIANGINLIKDLSLSYSQFQFGVIEINEVNLPKNENNQNILIQFCKNHQKKKNYICIHKECVENNLACLFFCKQCYQDNHKKHDFQNWAKKYNIIMKEQKEKSRLIFDQQQNVKQKIQENFNIIIKQIQENQLEENKIYQQKKKEIFQLKEKQINNLNNIFQFKQNDLKIDINLLNQNDMNIKQLFSRHSDQFIKELSQINESIKSKKNMDQICSNLINLQQTNKNLIFQIEKQKQMFNPFIQHGVYFRHNFQEIFSLINLEQSTIQSLIKFAQGLNKDKSIIYLFFYCKIALNKIQILTYLFN